MTTAATFPPSIPAAFTPRWRLDARNWLAVAVGLSLLGLTFTNGISELLRLWGAKEEYSHAYLIPFISLFLAWQKKNELAELEWSGSWIGFLLCVVGVGTFFAGSLSTIYAVVHYALIITLAGAVIGTTGRPSLRYLWPALVYLIFMIPLPQFLYQALSNKLQLLSSELGVAVIRLFGIGVFLEGNVIDLGTYKLQVVEACNGLRYLFPLLSFGFLCAYFYRGPFWHRVVVMVSTVPITVFMNSFRIGVIGYTVDRWGQEMADGFLHDFEGWAIFMACLAVLFGEIWILSRLQRPPRAFADAFYVEMPAPGNSTGSVPRKLPRQYFAIVGVLLIGAILSFSIVKRAEVIPARVDFSEFPLELGKWRGQRDSIEQVYLDVLKLTDYVMVNYVQQGSASPVNFYSAYYESQRAGESAHSPRSCIPGGGWKIESLTRVQLKTGAAGGHLVNRVQIAMGENRQLVYYWFQQRGRIINNEYLVKWYLFWDALTRNRSDGSLVRLTTVVLPNETWADGDVRLNDFGTQLGDTLKRHVPE
jgi:exosortase D (VPLPA-CTERM-specific)